MTQKIPFRITKKALYTGGILAYAFTILASSLFFMVGRIEAQQPARWLDNFNIEFQGTVFTSDDYNHDWSLYGDVDNDGCADEIDGIDWDPLNDDSPPSDNTAKYQKYINTATGCAPDGSEIDLDLSNANATDTSFAWDGENIRSTNSDNPIIFSWREDLGTYVRSDTRDRCEAGTTLQTTVGSNQAILTIVGGRGESEASFRLDYRGFSFNQQITLGDVVNECRTTQSITISLGATDQAGAPGTGSGTVVGGVADDDSCEGSGGPFAFIICPVLTLSNSAFSRLDDEILDALDVEEAYYEDTDVKEAWAQIRNIGYILLIPVMLVMVIGTALGFSFVDAYTVKRALPRLFAAVIFMALSYDIGVILIEVVNTVGQGVAGIIAAPFDGLDELTLQDIFTPNEAGGGVAIGVLAGVGAWVAMGPALITVLASYLGILVLILLIIFIMLAVRELLIIFLLIIGPLAIISWIFPGNDKLWKLWWGSFSKLLYLFPVIIALLTTGRAFAKVVNENSGADGFVITLLKLTAFVGPYFFIPKAFSLAGGAFANIAGMANDRGRGIFDRQRKTRSKAMSRGWDQKGRRNVTAKRADLASDLRQSASKDRKGIRGAVGNALLRGAAGGVGAGNIEAKASALRAQAGKELQEQINTGRDENIRGLTAMYAYDAAKKDEGQAIRDNVMKYADVKDADGNVIGQKKQYKSLGGAWIDEADVLDGKKRWGNDRYAQQEALSYEMRKAMTKDEVDNLRTNYAAQAESWGLSGTETVGMLKGSGFANQNQNLVYKYMKADGSVDMAGMSKEIYEKRGSYQLSQQSGAVIQSMAAEYQAAEKRVNSGKAKIDPVTGDNIDQQNMERIAAISETFVARGPDYGGQGMIPAGDDGALVPAAQPVQIRQPGAQQGTILGPNGQPIVGGQPQERGQTMNSGAAKVGQDINDLARVTGRLYEAPSQPYTPDGPQDSSQKR